jgi:hypothetical protein
MIDCYLASLLLSSFVVSLTCTFSNSCEHNSTVNTNTQSIPNVIVIETTIGIAKIKVLENNTHFS